MTQGYFYFIADDFYAKFPNDSLRTNRGSGHDRPCFFAFRDNKDSDILWCVPISSKVEKYKIIANKKVSKQIKQGVVNPICETIRFGTVLGKERAFLIQNIFPVTQEYITGTYLYKGTSTAVRIDKETEKDIIVSARKVLRRVFRGNSPYLVFADVKAMKRTLVDDLKKRKDIANDKPSTAKSWCEKTLQSAQKLADAHNLNNDMPNIDDDGSR